MLTEISRDNTPLDEVIDKFRKMVFINLIQNHDRNNFEELAYTLMSADNDNGYSLGIWETFLNNIRIIKCRCLDVTKYIHWKNTQTLPLLQTSETQTQKYKEQTQKYPTKFLYSALKILNECDINYRQSSNKRLLVEITLIRVAQITQPDEDGVAGRSPKRLKSLFKKLIASAQRHTAVQQVAAAASQAQPGENKAVQGVAVSSPDNAPSASSQVTATPGNASTVSATQPQHRPALKLGSIGKSFGNLMKGPEKPTYEMEPEQKATTGLHETFDDDMLLQQWLLMCNRMPPNMLGTSKRMKNLTPVITEFPKVEVVIDNKMLLEDVQKIKNRVRNTLVQKLRNDDIELSLRLARPEEIKRILSPKEFYLKLCKENDAVGKLGELLNLEFA